jgi:uncharacterized protein
MAAELPANAGTLFIQFARAPVAGEVKTRMIPHLSPAQACDLHRDLVLWTCRRLIDAALGAVELAVAGDKGHPLFERCRALGLETLTTQAGGDLGHNMYCAIRDGLARYESVVLVGSDCPALDEGYLRAALAALDTAPLVLGPATDGGYVLIGARQICPELFRGVPWGTSQVYAETALRLRQLGWEWVELKALADIDRPEDLPGWHTLRGQGRQGV